MILSSIIMKWKVQVLYLSWEECNRAENHSQVSSLYPFPANVQGANILKDKEYLFISFFAQLLSVQVSIPLMCREKNSEEVYSDDQWNPRCCAHLFSIFLPNSYHVAIESDLLN